MRVALLGNLRFIGRWMAEGLVREGFQTLIVHDGRYPAVVKDARYVAALRGQHERLARWLREFQPDVLVDTAAMTGRDAELAMSALPESVEHVVVLSSQDVYAQFGSLLGHPAPAAEQRVTESSPLTVSYPFRGVAEHRGGADYDKKDVERVYRDAEVERVTVLRLPATYGRYDSTRRFGWLLDALDRGDHALPCSDGSWRWTHAHAGDLADALLALLGSQVSGSNVFNLGEVDTPTMEQRAFEISRVAGAQLTLEDESTTPEEFAYLGPMANDFVVDTSAFREATGFVERTSTDDRLEDLVRWLRESREKVP